MTMKSTSPMNTDENIFGPADDILKHVARSTLATLSLDDCETARRQYEALRCNGTAKRRRRERKPTLAAALKQASKAGQHVSGAVIEDGKIELKFGKQDADDTAAANEWDEVYGKDKAPTRQ
jgi:hypothetical protein